MQARVKWVEGLSFLGESASGHQILMDGNAGDKVPTHVDMVLMAPGGCSAVDVVSILQKGRYSVSDCEVKFISERQDKPLCISTHINVYFIASDAGLSENAVALSAEKYCSVAIMLGKSVKLTHRYERIETG